MMTKLYFISSVLFQFISSVFNAPNYLVQSKLYNIFNNERDVKLSNLPDRFLDRVCLSNYGIYPDYESKCRKYYECYKPDKFVVLRNCQQGQAFDFVSQSCEEENEATCLMDTEIEALSLFSNHIKDVPKNRIGNERVKCMGAFKVIPGTNCNAYFECHHDMGGNKELILRLKCDPGKVFDETAQECVDGSLIECDDNFEQTNFYDYL